MELGRGKILALLPNGVPPFIHIMIDRSTLLCETIARILFLRDLPEYAGIEDAHYAYRIRDHLRKQVLSPLRKALQLPEVYMSAHLWNERAPLFSGCLGRNEKLHRVVHQT